MTNYFKKAVEKIHHDAKREGRLIEGKSLDELDLRSRYGINVVAILHGDDINIAPLPSDKITEGSKLIVLGSNSDINEIKRLKNRGRG